MEYVYAAMLLHKAGKDIDESSVAKVLEAAGIEVNQAKVKALVAALDGVDIEQAIKDATIAAPAAAAPAAGEAAKEEAPKEEKKEEKKDDKAAEQQAAAGLGALFG